MKSIYKAAIALVLGTALLWAILVGFFYYAPGLNIRFYPATSVPIAAVTPLLFGAFIARLIVRDRRKPTPGEWWGFRLIVLIGIGLAGYIAEAGMLHAALNQAETIPFKQILFAPVTERYTVSALFGLSFFSSGMLIAAFLAIVTVPARVFNLLRTD